MQSYHDRPEYDANVLAPVDALTKGYDANVLAPVPAQRMGMHSGYAMDPREDKLEPRRRDDLESSRRESSSKYDKVTTDSIEPKASIPAKPFYQSKKGAIALVLICIVIVVAIIGGVVGAKRSHSSLNGDVNAPAPSLTSADGSGNGSVASGTPAFPDVTPRVSGSGSATVVSTLVNTVTVGTPAFPGVTPRVSGSGSATVVSTLVNTVTVGIASGLAGFPAVTPLPQNP